MIFYELLSALDPFHPIGYMRSNTEILIYSMLPVETTVFAQPNILYLIKDKSNLSFWHFSPSVSFRPICP